MAKGTPSATINWERIGALYSRFTSPLRPCDADVALYRQAIQDNDARVLLLGVTPVLAPMGQSLLAVDAMPSVISALWIGDSTDRRAVVGDWRNLPCKAHSRTAIIGDAVFSAADVAPEQLLSELLRVLDPSGVIAVRAICAPAVPETSATILDDLLNGRVVDMSVLKVRLGMQIAASDPDCRVPVADILSEFNRLVPDRALLLERTGWDENEFVLIDLYQGSTAALRFLPEERFISALSRYVEDIKLLRPTGYPLAECCSLVVMRHPRQ